MEPTEKKVTDIVGNELQPGDFVVFATSCTATGKLRRGIFQGVNKYKRWGNLYTVAGFKSVCLRQHSYWKDNDYTSPNREILSKTVLTTGSSSVRVNGYGKPQDSPVIKLDCVRISDLELLFSPEEIEFMTTTTRFLKNSETNEKVSYIDIVKSRELQKRQWKTA